MRNNKLDIKLGFACNNNCKFCVIDNDIKKTGNKTTAHIKNELKKSSRSCEFVTLTGGEITIRKDIFEIIRYAKKLDYKVIQLQTNGRMFSNKSFCKKLIEAGANSFGPSLHGPNARVHDYLTNAKGSFDETVKGISNLRSLNMRCTANSVITKPNYRYLPETTELFASLGIRKFQFAFMHANGNAYKNFEKMMPNMTLASKYIKKAIDVSLKHDMNLTIEAVPFCFLEGYEKHTAELYGKCTELKGITDEAIDWDHMRLNYAKRKFKDCKKCKFELICEGSWIEYPDLLGEKEFIPVIGEKVKSKENL